MALTIRYPKRDGLEGENKLPLPVPLRDIVNGYGLTLSSDELRAHLRLLMFAWNGHCGVGCIPNVRRLLMGFAAVSPQRWKLSSEKILTTFALEVDTWVHYGMVDAWAKRREKPARTRRGVSSKLRFFVLQRDGFACRYCGRKAPDVELQVDHVHPVSAGGESDVSNLVTACVECNAGKTDRVILGLGSEHVQ